VHEGFRVDRDPDMRRPWVGRVEEDQIPALKVRRLYRHANRKLLDDRSGNHNPFGLKDVPDEAAAVEAGSGIVATKPIRYAAKRQRLINHARRHHDHGAESSAARPALRKRGRANHTTRRGAADCADGQNCQGRDRERRVSRGAHTEPIGAGARRRQSSGCMLINHCNH
jgi:hypothetical protein